MDVLGRCEAENEALGEELEQAYARYYAMRDDRDRLQILADVRAERLAGAVAALRSLRAAWDEHMKTCPQHANVPSFEEIDAWMKAPSNTASGGAVMSWQDPSTDLENVNAAYVIERDDNTRLRAEIERLREVIAEAPDWGEQYLREMDERKRQGDRAHKWKTRAEAAEEALTSIWIYLRLDGQHETHETHERFGAACGVDACILCLALATAEKPLESRDATDENRNDRETR